MTTMTSTALTRALLPFFLILPAWSAKGIADPVPQADAIGKPWSLRGLPTENEEHLNISGIAMSKDRELLVVGADEESAVQILLREDDGKYKLIDNGNHPLARGNETEIDIEGIARDGKRFWVIGSHSLKRKSVKGPEKLKTKDEKKREKGKRLARDYNHERMATVVPEPTREWLYVLKIKDNGKVDKDSIARASLRTIFANHPILSPFRAIPSKENGIDIEGLALIPDADDKKKAKLLVGLRGPVLRGPHAVVLVVDAERKKSELELELDDTLYLPLGGRGIRGLSRLDDDGKDFLVLAGPVGDAPVSYMIYQWNGKDGIPEIDDLDAAESLRPLCGIPQPAGATGAKAEGIHVLKQDNGKVHFVIVYDSAEDGGATEFACDLSGS